MTDKEKLEKVRAEIERRRDRHSKVKRIESALEDNAILSFIDSMQEEPKKCMYSKDNYTDEDRKILCEGCEEECKYVSNIPPVFDEGYWERLGEKPVSEDLEATLEEKKFEISDVCLIQYTCRDAGIKAHAEEYSFNIESELFQQLTPEQQKLWRKEIEQAVLSGGYCGLELANDRRYDKQGPVSEDLDFIATRNALAYVNNINRDESPWLDSDMELAYEDGMKAGANWQKQQMEAYRIEHCKSLTNEQAELEDNFVSSHVEKNNRIPTFIDAIEYGIEYGKQQMLKNAVSGHIGQTVNGLLRALSDEVDDDLGFEAGNKVKLIIIKEDSV